MILSVSRRTDIPAYYAAWFMNRLREGYVLVRNPMNYHQVSQVSLSPALIDCIVFWTKNAAPILPYIEEISMRYPFYVQYTLNAYDPDVEAAVPAYQEKISTFRSLSKKIGKDRVIWRYDPILLSPKYSLTWHAERFRAIASALEGYTSTCVFSFIDIYDKMKSNIKTEGIRACTNDEMNQIAEQFASIARAHQLTLQTCAEEIDLNRFGIKHGSCIDGTLIGKLIGCKLAVKKDSNQRSECGCVESIDIGQYNTCRHGCKYCYANFSQGSVRTFCEMHSDDSPLLIGNVEPEDKVTPRKNMKSYRLNNDNETQLSMNLW